MSLVRIRHSIFSLNPHVREARGVIHIRTNSLLRALCLFAFDREVLVPRDGSRVDVLTTRFWFFHEARSIRREAIAHLNYRYKSLPTAFTHGTSGGGHVRVRTADTFERFTLCLVLREGAEEIPLCTFSGSGSAMTGLEGVLFGDDLLDFEGTQQADSLALVGRITERLGVPLGPPLPIQLKEGVRGAGRCADCERPVPPRRARCQYCGGARIEP